VSRRKRTSVRLVDKVISPSEKYLDYFGVVIPIGSHANVLRTQPMQVCSDILSIASPLEQPEHLRNIAFVFIPGLRNAGDSNWIPYVVKDFIDPAKQFLVLR